MQKSKTKRVLLKILGSLLYHPGNKGTKLISLPYRAHVFSCFPHFTHTRLLCRSFRLATVACLTASPSSISDQLLMFENEVDPSGTGSYCEWDLCFRHRDQARGHMQRLMPTQHLWLELVVLIFFFFLSSSFLFFFFF